MGVRFSSQHTVHDVLFLIGLPYYWYHYTLFVFKSKVNSRGYAFLNVMLSDIGRYLPGVHARRSLLC